MADDEERPEPPTLESEGNSLGQDLLYWEIGWRGAGNRTSRMSSGRLAMAAAANRIMRITWVVNTQPDAEGRSARIIVNKFTGEIVCKSFIRRVAAEATAGANNPVGNGALR